MQYNYQRHVTLVDSESEKVLVKENGIFGTLWGKLKNPKGR